MQKVYFLIKVFGGYVCGTKKQLPRYLFFGCGVTHLNCWSKNLCRTFKLQKIFLKTVLKNEEVFTDGWRIKKDERMEYVENDVFSTTLSNGRYSKETTGFGLKGCLNFSRTMMETL